MRQRKIEEKREGEAERDKKESQTERAIRETDRERECDRQTEKETILNNDANYADWTINVIIKPISLIYMTSTLMQEWNK